jgi:hypothetical protein
LSDLAAARAALETEKLLHSKSAVSEMRLVGEANRLRKALAEIRDVLPANFWRDGACVEAIRNIAAAALAGGPS